MGRGGGVRLQHLVKWLWERVWDFSALGGLTSSRGYGDEIRNPVVFMIPSTGSGLGIGGRGMHNSCDFWN